MGVETRRTVGRGAAGRAPVRGSADREEFLAALETVSAGVRDPVAKLHFIRTSLSRFEALDRAVRTVPWAPARHLLYRWLSLEGLRHLLDTRSLGTSPVAVAVHAIVAGTEVKAADIKIEEHDISELPLGFLDDPARSSARPVPASRCLSPRPARRPPSSWPRFAAGGPVPAPIP